MKMNGAMDDLEARATEALRALLGQVSVIKLKEIRRAPQGPMLARVDVLGKSHTLACQVDSSARPETLRDKLRALQDGAAKYDGAATPVLIAPYFSPEAQSVCKENHAGFLDLEGNARLALGEIFIGKRALPQRNRQQASMRVQPGVLRRCPPARASVPPSTRVASA